MKAVTAIALCMVLVVGCGGDKKLTARIDELQSKNDDLTRRVKSLEDDLLAANKKLIQHEQTLQQMHERMREIENNFNKMQLGQSPVR